MLEPDKNSDLDASTETWILPPLPYLKSSSYYLDENTHQVIFPLYFDFVVVCLLSGVTVLQLSWKPNGELRSQFLFKSAETCGVSFSSITASCSVTFNCVLFHALATFFPLNFGLNQKEGKPA